MDAPIIKVVTQRHVADCGVACLAMLLGVSYENALVAVAQVAPDVCVSGLWMKHLQAAAKLLGCRLVRKRHFELDSDTGLLSFSSKRWKLDHLAVLREGLVIETDGTIYDADVYLAVHKAKTGTLLIAEVIHDPIRR